jgi:ribosome modulation factor
MNTQTAYQEGEAAHAAGKALTECPYEFRTKQYAEWRGGWSDTHMKIRLAELAQR